MLLPLAAQLFVHIEFPLIRSLPQSLSPSSLSLCDVCVILVNQEACGFWLPQCTKSILDDAFYHFRNCCQIWNGIYIDQWDLFSDEYATVICQEKSSIGRYLFSL